MDIAAESGGKERSPSEENGRGLTRDGTAKPVSRDKILRRDEPNHFPCSADHEEDWQPYPVDLYSSAIIDDNTNIQR